MRQECGVAVYKTPSDVKDYMKKMTEIQDDAFYVLDLTSLESKYDEWNTNLPTITPFYAVKCNHSIMVIKALAALGCCFDCASKSEMMKVISIGVSPDNIIYANPAKSINHLKYAAQNGIRMMTYDSVHEVQKIKQHNPQAELVLRVRADALEVKVSLGRKFGCEPENGLDLIKAAVNMGLKVIGISFHVGSGCSELGAYARAIHIACKLIRKAKENNISMKLLDIGGGFSGDDALQFALISQSINEALHKEQETLEGIRIIAEPGRYMVWSAYTLLATINGVKRNKKLNEYYINDGVYGSFNCVATEDILKLPTLLNRVKSGPLKCSRLWGHTDRQFDMVLSQCLLPEMDVGDWLMFKDMGSYSIPLSMNFNGFPIPQEYYVANEKTWSRISKFIYNVEKVKECKI